MFCEFSALRELLGINTGGEMLNSRVTTSWGLWSPSNNKVWTVSWLTHSLLFPVLVGKHVLTLGWIISSSQWVRESEKPSYFGLLSVTVSLLRSHDLSSLGQYPTNLSEFVGCLFWVIWKLCLCLGHQLGSFGIPDGLALGRTCPKWQEKIDSSILMMKNKS